MGSGNGKIKEHLICCRCSTCDRQYIKTSDYIPPLRNFQKIDGRYEFYNEDECPYCELLEKKFDNKLKTSFFKEINERTETIVKEIKVDLTSKVQAYINNPIFDKEKILNQEIINLQKENQILALKIEKERLLNSLDNNNDEKLAKTKYHHNT